ncbi:hypothetical protein AVEN_133094-1 [Araneus ventricosus]|uniref:Uncharacterized protein n=1 Tax=Araneus ventricosus TaxID=182803 RepID=A0A4Y2LRT0_ARAVE|nr:hypothetical protein AVEN_133094-1 [Araneus ventricosus]
MEYKKKLSRTFGYGPSPETRANRRSLAAIRRHNTSHFLSLQLMDLSKKRAASAHTHTTKLEASQKCFNSSRTREKSSHSENFLLFPTITCLSNGSGSLESIPSESSSNPAVRPDQQRHLRL